MLARPLDGQPHHAAEVLEAVNAAAARYPFDHHIRAIQREITAVLGSRK
jgi:hypothetical protein